MEDTSRRIAVQYVLPPDLIRDVKKRAIDEDREYSQVAEDAIRQYLATPNGRGTGRRPKRTAGAGAA
jgi:hypothetical protein